MNTNYSPIDADHINAYCFISNSYLVSEFRIIFEFHDDKFVPQIVTHKFRFNCDAFTLNFIATVAATLYINKVFKKKGTVYTSSQPVGFILAKDCKKAKPKYAPLSGLFITHSEGITGQYLPASEMPYKYDFVDYLPIAKDAEVEQLVEKAAQTFLLAKKQ